jgi:hypothetical protein
VQSYQSPQNVNAVDVELDTRVLIAGHAEVEPALGVALTIGALAVGGSPQRKLVGLRTHTFAQVAAVEVGIHDHLVAEVIEAERVLVGDAG